MQQSPQTLDISCPFRVFHLNENNYIISLNGQSLKLLPATSNKKALHSVQSMTKLLLILNKSKDELVAVLQNELIEADSNQIKDKLDKGAKK